MIGESIALVRERLGMSQVVLARRLGMTKPQLCKIEKGSSEPRPETLERIARALGVSTESLQAFDGEVGTDSPYAPIRTGSRPLTEVRRAMAKQEKRLDGLEKALGVRSATTVPLVHGYLMQPHSSEILARSLRDSLGVGTAAFADLVWTLEFANVRIHRLDLPEGVPSASWWHSGHETLSVVVAKGDTSERQLFRLAYELGAACLYRSSGNRCVAETKSERRFLGSFAADFLVPASALADMVAKTGVGRAGWTLARLCAFKRHFGVSAEALVIRLSELGLVDKHLRDRLRNELRAYYRAHPKSMEPAPCLPPLRDSVRLEVGKPHAHSEKDKIAR